MIVQNTSTTSLPSAAAAAATDNKKQLKQQKEEDNTFTIPNSDGDAFDADLWSLVYQPTKGNCVKQFASWREVMNDQLRQLDRRASMRSQLLNSELSHYVVKCTMTGDVRILSNVEFTGMCVCSSALVTQVVQMHGNLMSLLDICRCIIENAELSDATFATHLFSTKAAAAASKSASAANASSNSANQQQYDSLAVCTTAQDDKKFHAFSVSNSYRSSFVEMTQGGFQVPPPRPTADASNTGNQQQQQQSQAAALAQHMGPGIPVVSGGGGGGGASAAGSAAQHVDPNSPAGKAAAAGGKKKPGLPGAPKFSLPAATPGGGAASGASSSQQQPKVQIAAPGATLPSSSSSSKKDDPASSLFFTGAARPTQTFVPIYSLNTVSSFIRAHVATAGSSLTAGWGGG